MFFTPWRNEQKDLISSTFEAHYTSLKPSIESKSNGYENHTEEFELARQMVEIEENAFDQILPNSKQENRDADEEGVKEVQYCIFQSKQSWSAETLWYWYTTTVHLLCATSRNNLHDVTIWGIHNTTQKS